MSADPRDNRRFRSKRVFSTTNKIIVCSKIERCFLLRWNLKKLDGYVIFFLQIENKKNLVSYYTPFLKIILLIIIQKFPIRIWCRTKGDLDFGHWQGRQGLFGIWKSFSEINRVSISFYPEPSNSYCPLKWKIDTWCSLLMKIPRFSPAFVG